MIAIEKNQNPGSRFGATKKFVKKFVHYKKQKEIIKVNEDHFLYYRFLEAPLVRQADGELKNDWLMENMDKGLTVSK